MTIIRAGMATMAGLNPTPQVDGKKWARIVCAAQLLRNAWTTHPLDPGDGANL